MRFLLTSGLVIVIALAAACSSPAPITPAPQPTTAPARATPIPPPSRVAVVTATAEAPGAPTATLAPAEAAATPVPAAPVPTNSKLVGSYAGILPAADAPGRIILLDLALDGSATMITQFIGKGAPSIESGTWVAQDNRAVATFSLKDGQHQDNRITWQLEGNQLTTSEYDTSQYGSAGLPLTRIGTRDLLEASFEGVSFSFDSSLAQSAQGAFLAPVPVENAPALGGGAPEGIRFRFDNETLPDYFDPHLPQVYVYPVEGLKQLDPSVAAGVDSLQKLLQEKPENPSGSIFVFPLIPASQGMHTNVQYLDFVNGSGVRFITYYAQDISPVTNNQIFYTFQGITLDGKWYVSAFWPVSTPALPNAENAPDTSRFNARQFEAYLNQIITTLNSLPNAGYAPNLTLLDNMSQSISASPLFPTPTLPPPTP